MTRAGTWTTVMCLLVAGCAGTPKQVSSMAESDLGCERVEITEISDHRYGAYGCGRGAVYAEICDHKGCRFGRLRHGHEPEVAQASAPTSGGSSPRAVIAAPPPESRAVIAAPPPESREVIPAPPPSGSGPTAVPDAGANAPSEQQGAEQRSAPAPAPAPAPPATPTPLSEGDLSAPYQAQVPAQPTTQQTEYPPPAPLVETRPSPPSTTYVWVGGYWWWGPSSSWLWVPGYWCPPRPGFAYVSGSWYWSSGWWWYTPGGWAYPGTRVVVYPPPVRVNRVTTVRSFTPHRVVAGGGTVDRRVARVVPGSVGRGTYPSAGFRPSTSPLLRYPATARVVAPRSSVRATTSFGARSTSGVGRVVGPREVVRPRSSSSHVPSRGFERAVGHYGYSPSRSAVVSSPRSRSSFDRPVSARRVITPSHAAPPRATHRVAPPSRSRR